MHFPRSCRKADYTKVSRVAGFDQNRSSLLSAIKGKRVFAYISLGFIIAQVKCICLDKPFFKYDGMNSLILQRPAGFAINSQFPPNTSKKRRTMNPGWKLDRQT